MMASSRTGWIPSFTLYFLVLFCLSSLGIDFCWAQGKLTVESSGGDRKVDTQSDSEEEDAAPINSVMPDMTFSGLLPLNDSLFCLLDEDGSYCLMKDINQVDPIVITSLAELSKITEDALDDFCMMRKVSHCSRLMQALVVEPDGPMSRNIPRGTACARHADGTYCMSNFVKMTKIPDIDRCWFQRMKGFCSPSCAKTFRKMVEVLGCCARPATILLGSIGNTDALSALQICPGFENISSIVDQNCGGLSKVGPSKAVQEVSFTLDIPCNLLDFLENTLETLFRDEISDIADAETKHISAVRMSCSKLPISSGMHYTENSHLNLMRIPGMKLHATTVTFRITSGLIADEAASILLQRLQTRGSYFSFPALTALVRSLFVDSPLVTVLDAPRATSNQALAQHLGNAECDPLKFLDVVTKCWELLEVYTQSTTDDEVEWSEHIMCDSMSPCAQALKALGTENLVHCKPMPRAGGLIGLSYMYIMCERNEAGIPCSRYLRMEDLVYFCKQLPMDECMVEKDCLWDKNSGQCAMSPQPNYLQGFCGTCHNKLVDVSTMLAPQNREIPPLASSSLTSMCMRSRNVYCSEIFAQDVHVLVQTPTGQSTAATHGLLRSDDFCGADDAQRCHRMALILSAQRTRLEADACTAHPFLCVDKVEYALKQDLITQSFLKYGCLMDADGRQRCMDRTDMLTPEAMTCYAQSLIAPTCDERCAQIWKTELSSLGCCIQHMDTYLESLDADQVPMHLRGLRKLQACIPDVAQLLSNPLCKESITQGKAIEKVVQFDVPCSLVTDELKQILVEKLPEDLSLAAGVPREFVKVTSVTCQLGTKVSQTTTYHTEKGKIKNDGQPSSENGLITVSYEIKAQDQEETQAASEAINAFVEAHGELMWLEVSFAEVLGQAYDVNFSQ